ncbi:Histidine kinase-, DNA gyrase B-, and HSP90-like ATPase [Halomicrobium zhouii]|uniref:Histidine kinase-, DNA gyrase B-, and HSP90-like ATPase n=1 Tax=Halomicrobium zhouii TaxID=767519 RepID=A0A1I6L0F4_9EURY|nr:ATP-binding protein [Halomicrobium zhouii]SFR96937.1 Histidine kinase-, DNA gyrase B-, and HSP90-like ATPase [Halomicrobium zhouii]
MRKEPKVNKVNEFLEIASDFEDPLEVIRESLSNAYDANATTVDIRIRTRPHGSDIVIEDDGDGMNERDLESFFDLGNSRKTDSIGYKGHGTKIFYKSDAIEVNTAKDGTNRRAVMESPWAKLNRRELPEYELTEQPTRAENPGTLIKIQNFRSGQGFDPESLTYNKIEHYLKWKTIAGSTAYLFDDDFQEMDITVDLDEEIDDSMDQLTTTNKLELPSEQREPSDGEFPAARMCKHYPARELEVDYDGGSTTIQIVGVVGGKETRNEFPTYGRHSAQFGVWFAKDHIKVERLNEAISHDNEFIHFFFVVNCQDFELSANRETIRNKASPVYRAIAEEVEFYLSKVTQDPWFKDYLVTRREGELQRRAESQQSTLTDRRETVDSRDIPTPSNRAELLLTLQRVASGDRALDVTVEDFEPNSDVHAIVRQSGKLRNAAVHLQATEHFEEEIPLSNVDLLLCWDVGDPTVLEEFARSGYIGGEVELALDDDALTYVKDGSHYIEILEVKELLQEKQAVVADD